MPYRGQGKLFLYKSAGSWDVAQSHRWDECLRHLSMSPPRRAPLPGKWLLRGQTRLVTPPRCAPLPGKWPLRGQTRLVTPPCRAPLPGNTSPVAFSEVCVETTVVVDTLGPARRRTYGLCVTVRCSDRYLCTCRIEKECVKYTSLKKIRVGI